MQMAATLIYKVRPKVILWEGVVREAVLVAHLQPTVPMRTTAVAVVGLEGTAHLTVLVVLEVPHYSVVGPVQAVGKKAETHLEPLAIGEVIPLALVRRLVL